MDAMQKQRLFINLIGIVALGCVLTFSGLAILGTAIADLVFVLGW